MISYKAEWESDFAARKNGYLEVLEKIDRFSHWEQNRNPEVGVEQEFYSGLRIFYADPESRLGKRFIERAIAVAERALDENKLENELCAPFLPKNRAELLRAYVYSKFLLEGEFDCLLLKDAADGIYQWQSKKGIAWDDFGEWLLLSAVRLALLCEDSDSAVQWLREARKFKYNKVEADILLHIAEGDGSSAVSKAFRAFYDRSRAPKQSIDYFIDFDMHRFELGLLKVTYFPAREESLTPLCVIKSISE